VDLVLLDDRGLALANKRHAILSFCSSY